MDVIGPSPHLTDRLAVAAALLRQIGDLPQPASVSVSVADGLWPIKLEPPPFTGIADFKTSVDAVAAALDVKATLEMGQPDYYRASGTFQNLEVLALVVRPAAVGLVRSFSGSRLTNTTAVANLLDDLAEWVAGMDQELFTALMVHDHQSHLSVQALFVHGREAVAAGVVAAALPAEAPTRGWGRALLPSGHTLTYNIS